MAWPKEKLSSESANGLGLVLPVRGVGLATCTMTAVIPKNLNCEGDERAGVSVLDGLDASMKPPKSTLSPCQVKVCGRS